jgi:phosphoglycerol transferase MdoB-like AlkP superfamily enzyme
VASVAIAATYVGLLPLLTRAADQCDLEKTMIGDVLTSLVTDNEEGDDSLYPPSAMDDEDLEEDSADDLTEAARAMRANTRRLNLVYYVIESSPIRETSLIETPPYDTTPFLKELADDGLLFTNYYNVFPGSTRGVFTSLTGTYPYLDATSDISGYAEIDVPSLPDVLREAGYRTAVFASSDTFFDSLDTFLARRSYDHYMDTNLLTEDERREHASSFWGVDEELMIDKALEWIAESAGSEGPFFLHYMAIYPHHPYKVPARAAGIAAQDFGDGG